MTQQLSGNDRLFLKDEQGNYYVQGADMTQPVRVPDANKQEVEEVLEGQVGDVSGFVFSPATSFQTSATTFGGTNLTALGRCNGACARSFGVFNQGLAR